LTARLRWQCRRGMRELDELLLDYLATRFEVAPAEEKAAFEALLELPDPELLGYLLQNRQAPPALQHVVTRILDRPLH